MKLQQKKNEYQCLYKKDDELKGDNITDETRVLLNMVMIL